MGLNVSVPPKNHVENLTPKVMVLGSGAFGKCPGQKGRALMNGISGLIKEAPERPPVLSAM